ncbi:MAG: pseudouridine-5'-phosphate glycosidase [Actinobacteria bacterium]|nr:MAG: pseudouridine-5'-phosphate glycosidase [Actinomycetota bacterium]
MCLAPWGDSVIQVTPEVRDALDSGRAVVGLETTLVAHGFPGVEGLDVALEAERRVRETGAVPATVGVLDGRVQVGLDAGELERFAAAGDSARKAGPRDLAVCVAAGVLGATTVGGTLAVCSAAGVRFMGTGGIGGVHRGFAERPDVSADLGELARASVLVVWQVETLPLFYTAEGGPPAPATVATASEAAAIARAHWSLGRAGLVLARAPAENLDVEPLIEAALTEARARQVTGQAVTPFVLAEIHRESGGESVRINKRLIADNAALAAEVAVAYTKG